MSTRVKILDAIKKNMEDTSSIRDVFVNKVSPVDLDIAAFPAAFIYSDSEELVLDERATMGFDTWEWQIVIEVWTNQYAVLDEILVDVHNSMFKNYRLDGYAMNSYRTSMSEVIIDPAKEIKAMILNYSILYQHKYGLIE